METTWVDVVRIGIAFGFLAFFVFIFLYFYTKYELRCLKIDGYQALRLKEKELRISREIKLLELKYDLKIAKINGGK